MLNSPNKCLDVAKLITSKRDQLSLDKQDMEANSSFRKYNILVE